MSPQQFYNLCNLLPGLLRSQTSIGCESHWRGGGWFAGLKLFTKFNKIYHRRSTRAHAENFIVWCIPSGFLMKGEGEGDEETFVCNSDHLEGEHTNHEEILPQGT